MKKFIAIIATLLVSVSIWSADAATKDKDQVVVFKTTLHCKKCAAKINDNIAFEKGVKELDVKVEDKTVRIVYSPSKTDISKLSKAINKLGYEAEVIEKGDAPAKAKK